MWINRSREWDKEIPHGVLPMGQVVLSDKWARSMSPQYKKTQKTTTENKCFCFETKKVTDRLP